MLELDESTSRGEWPELQVAEWTPTRETLHRWLQVVGKIRLAHAPMVNHWWQVPFYVTPRGLTTSAIPVGQRLLEIEFDLVRHVLTLDVDSGHRESVELTAMPVSAFYAETLAALARLGLPAAIPRAVPVELADATPFDEDHDRTSYDPGAVTRFWGQLVRSSRVLDVFRSRFVGKVSPVHVFWGGLDLACTRFSGRTAPRHPGGAPNVGDWVMVEGYSHELSSCGFWPGGDGEGMFYAYAYPEPAGYPEHPVQPAEAFYYRDGGQFVLPYTVVRESPDPDATLLAFLQSTYAGAADLGGWDRAALEDDPVRRANPR